MPRTEADLCTAHQMLSAERVVTPNPSGFRRAFAALPPLLPTSATEPSPSPQAEPTYPTGFGRLTFAEMYAATDRIVGYTLREQLGMTNPQDVDDCMQAGYFKVWQQLQSQPELFAGKPKKFVVQAVVLRSKAQRYAHLRHYRKLEFDAEAPACSQGFPTTRQIETWIDLQRAIETVGEHVATLDTAVYLLALYTLLTEVRVQDVAVLYGHGVSSLTKARKQIRATLARELPGYGQAGDTSDALFVPQPKRQPPTRFSKDFIAPKLFDDAPVRPPTPSAPDTHSPQPPALPEAAKPAREPRYPTKWREAVTLEELLTDEQVRKVAFAKARSIGYTGQDAEDCVQLGCINLWKALQTQPNLLRDKGSVWVGVWIAFSGSRRTLWKHTVRSVAWDASDRNWNNAIERLRL